MQYLGHHQSIELLTKVFSINNNNTSSGQNNELDKTQFLNNLFSKFFVCNTTDINFHIIVVQKF